MRERQRTRTRLFGIVYKVGDLVADRYRILDVVGTGGAGVVYRVRDQELDVDVALKCINARLLKTADERRLFSREVKQAKKLNHQNVVRIFDELRDGERVLLTMQFLDGLSLRRIIDLRRHKGQTFTLAEIEPIYSQLCQALDYVHRTTIHGALKPDNIIVLPDLLKITDFGLVRGLPRKPFLAIQRSRGSSLPYFAPEVRLEVEELSLAVDIFSLGVILGEMLFGRIFDETKTDLVADLTGALAQDGEILDGVHRILRRCLMRIPKERYLAAGELYEELRTLTSKSEENKTTAAEPLSAAPSVTPEVRHAESSLPSPEPLRHDMDAPTVRFDVLRHAAMAGDESPEPVVADAADEFPRDDEELEGGTGTFAEIDDDMIEESSASISSLAKAEAVLPIPPLAEEDLRALPEGEEPTEAIDELVQLSASQVVLIADPSGRQRVEWAPVTDDGNANLRAEEQGRAFGAAAELEPLAAPVFNDPPQEIAHDETPAPARVGNDGDGAASAEKRVEPYAVAQDISPEQAVAAETSEKERTQPSSPEPQIERRARMRPMTRPRMDALSAQLLESRAAIEPDPTVPLPTASPRPGAPRSDPRARQAIVPPNAGRRHREAHGAKGAPRRVVAGVGAGAILAAALIAFGIFASVKSFSPKSKSSATLETPSASQEVGRNTESGTTIASLSPDALRATDIEKDVQPKNSVQQNNTNTDSDRATTGTRALAPMARRGARPETERDQKQAQEVESRAMVAEDARKLAAAERKRKQAEEAEARAARARADEDARKLAETERKRKQAEEAEARAARARADEDARKLAETERKRKQAEEAEARAAAEAKRKAADTERTTQTETTLASNISGHVQLPGLCPKGMALVSGGAFSLGTSRSDPDRNFGDLLATTVEIGDYCIDYYEGPNGRDKMPTRGVTYQAAEQACKAKGKRLCTEPEWEKACKGTSGLRFPYGNQWDAAACGTVDEAGQARPVMKSASYPACRSGVGAYDLSGNLAEWTQTPWAGGGGRVVKGGASDRPGYDARCAARKKKTESASDERLGYRCCSDAR